MIEQPTCSPEIAVLRVHAHYLGAESAALEQCAAEARATAQELEEKAAAARRRYFGTLAQINRAKGWPADHFDALS